MPKISELMHAIANSLQILIGYAELGKMHEVKQEAKELARLHRKLRRALDGV